MQDTEARDTIPAAALLARAEAAGLLLRLGEDGGVWMEGVAPPPGLLAALRRHWADLLDLLLLRKVLDIPPPDRWLENIAAAIRAALAAGARPEADDAGWMYLEAPDGTRLALAPDTLAQLVQAGLLRPAETGRGRCLTARNSDAARSLPGILQTRDTC